MFLKVISSNLRGSISICSSLGATTAHTLPVTRNRLLQIVTIRSSTVQYSTEKAASSLPKSTNNPKSADKNAEFSLEEIHSLKQDPDNFGTLSSFQPPAQEKATVQTKLKEKTVSNQKPSNQKSKDEYKALLKNIIKEKGVLEAVRVFEDEMLRTDRFLAPVQTYEWLIDECLHLNHYDKAFDLYDHMVNRRLRISLPIIEKLTLAFEPSGLSMKKVNSLRKILAKQNHKPTASIFNAMVRIHFRAGQWPTGLELANEMVQNGFKYEFDTINLMLEACKFDQNNGFCRLLELWHEMHRLKYTPNTHTINALLDAVHRCEINHVDTLLNTVESIQANWQSVSDAVNSIESSDIKADDLIDDGRPNLLKVPPTVGYLVPMKDVTTPEHRLLILGGMSEVFKLIKTHEIIPTLHTVKALLRVSPNSFTAQQKVIRLLKKHNILPDAQLFNILLMKICMRQNFRDAMEVIEMMYTFNVEVDLVSYGLLAITCRTAQEANELFAEADRNHVKLDDDILNAMMKNACAASDNNFVISLIRMMQAKQIEPLEETVAMVEEYQHQVFRNLRNQRVHSKQTRNECFKLTRECKQFLRHFRLDKRSGNRGAKLIETPVDKQTENKGSKINEAPVNHKSKDKRKSIQSSA